MRKLSVFNHCTLDGYVTDPHNGMDWAKEGRDPELDAFTEENAKGGGALVFGRVTYQMMAGFWPTPLATQMMPELAQAMNAAPKYVFSRTLASADWRNTTLLKGGLGPELVGLKGSPGPDLVILGSPTLVAQVAGMGLIDEYQVILNPLALGGGRSMFEGLEKRLDLKLGRTKVFKSGKLFLSYRPA